MGGFALHSVGASAGKPGQPGGAGRKSGSSSGSHSGSKGGQRAKGPQRSAAHWLALALVLCITLGVAYQAQQHLRVFFTAGKARYSTDQWASGATAVPSANALERALSDMNKAAQITPDDPHLQEQLGDLHMVAAEYLKDDLDTRQTHLQQALAQYQRALDLRPADPQTWAALAVAHHAAGEVGAPMQQAWLKSLQLGPNEGHVWPMLLEVALADWATASPAMQAWVQEFYAKSNKANRAAVNKIALRYGLRLQAADEESAQVPPAAGATPR